MMNQMLDYAQKGILELVDMQRDVLGLTGDQAEVK